MYNYNSTQWTKLRGCSGNRYKNEIIDFPQSYTANMLSIRLQNNGDRSRGEDRCYWDNLILRGISFTLKPSNVPTNNLVIIPTRSPTNNPTLIPSNQLQP